MYPFQLQHRLGSTSAEGNDDSLQFVNQSSEVVDFGNFTFGSGDSGEDSNDGTVPPYPALLALDDGPGSHIFSRSLLFSNFNEKTLSLRSFFNAVQGCTLGQNDELPDENIFRGLIASHASETLVLDDEKNRILRLYVLYLLSVHPENDLVSACVDYVKNRPFEIRAFEILPIYLNFGCTAEVLTGSDEPLNLPVKFRDRLEPDDERRFPYLNLEMVADVLLYYADLELIKKDDELKILLKALSRVSMDRKISCSRIISTYSMLISVISNQLAHIYNHDDIVSCLHLTDEHPLNRTEFVLIVHMPILPQLHELLLLRTINFMLTGNDSAEGDTFGARYVFLVLHKMIQLDSLPLDNVFCIFQLMNSSLPNVTATELEARAISAMVMHLQAKYVTRGSLNWLKLQVEMVRLKLVIRSCVVKRTRAVHLRDIIQQ